MRRASRRAKARRPAQNRSNFSKPLDCVLVVPADGGFPCGRRLRGDVVRAVVETRGVVGQHQVEVGDVDVRLVPVDQRDPIRGHADVARVVVAVDDAYLTSDELGLPGSVDIPDESGRARGECP